MASTLIVDQIQKTGGSTTALTLPTSNASASQYLQNNGAGALSWATVAVPAAGGLAGTQVYTASSNTWTKATREAALGVTITKVMVYVTGGGGGGKTNAPSAGTGGHSGTTAIKLLDVSSVTSATVSVGLAGAGGSSPTAGGNSSWVDTVNTDVIGIGGPAGTAGATNTTPRVVSTGGDINTYSSVTYGATYMSAGSYWGGGSSETTARNYGEGGYSAYVGTGYAGMSGVVYVMEYM